MPINKVGTRGIEDGAVATVDVAPGAVTSAKIADGGVPNSKLANTSAFGITLGGSSTRNDRFINWQSVVVSDGSTVTTMVAGRGYFINNSSAAGIVKLPTSAVAGDTIAIKDYTGQFGTNNLTIQRNGHKIQGTANDGRIATNRASVELVYVDATKGWLYSIESNVDDLQLATYISATGGTITTSGNFKIHTFTGDGNFIVSSLGNDAGGPNSVDYLVVAGGGAGGTPGGNSGGGGGAGGLRFYVSPDITSYPASPRNGPAAIPVSVATFPITVGGGSASKTHPSPNPGVFRGSSSVFSTITSTGGGDGGHAAGGGNPGNSGGSGGGGTGGGLNKPGGAGNTPPVSPSQGSAGGDRGSPGPDGGGGGGGGFMAAGAAADTGTDKAGGVGGGFPSAAFGANGQPAGDYRYFSGGGQGGGNSNPSVPANALGGGGATGGPASGPEPARVGTPGTANTGGGGGGPNNASTGVGGAGGKGIVVIRYKFQ